MNRLARWTRLLSIGLLMILQNLHAESLSTLSSPARGAILFTNYCSGCHSLHYLSWERMQTDLQLTQHSNLQIHPGLQLSMPNLKTIWPEHALSKSDAESWFGRLPPDLSLSSRQRGTTWIKEYLLGFYAEPNHRFGVNNTQLPQTKMPNILESIQHQVTPQEFDAILSDITNFLEYTGEPATLIRYKIGRWVLGFLLVACVGFYRWTQSSDSCCRAW